MAESGGSAEVERLVDAAKGVSSTHEATTDDARGLHLARLFKFKNAKDLLARWPDGLELKDEGDGLYSYQGRMIVTQDNVFHVLEAEYDDLPKAMGSNKLAKLMASRYIGISTTQVRRFLEINESHTQWRQRRRSQRVHAVIATKPGAVLQADLTDLRRGPDDNTTLKDTRLTARCLTIIDTFTKMIYTAVVKGKSAETIVGAIAKILEALPYKVGVLKTDNGLEFKNATMDALAERLGFKHLLGVPHLPLGQGGVESANRRVKEYLYSLSDRQGAAYLAVNLRKATATLNNSINAAHGFRPVDLAVNDLPERVRKLVVQRLRQASSGTDANAKYNFPLKPGDKVQLDVTVTDKKFAAQRKSHQFKASHVPTYGPKLYTVISHSPSTNLVKLEGFDRMVTRGDVVKVVQTDDKGSHVQAWQDPQGLKAWEEKRAAWRAQHNT